MVNIQKHKCREEIDRKSLSNVSNLHTSCRFKKQNHKSGPSYRRGAIHPSPHMPKGESAKPEKLLLLILSLVSKSDEKEVPCILSNPLFKKNFRGQKHPREVDKCKNSIPNIDYIRHTININIRYKKTSVRNGQARISYPISKQYINNN